MLLLIVELSSVSESKVTRRSLRHQTDAARKSLTISSDFHLAATAGKPISRNVTTYASVSEACGQCITFYPAKEKCKNSGVDKFSSGPYKDKVLGGQWDSACRAGPCQSRDHLGAGATTSDRTCLTLAPVPWYQDCEAVVLNAAHSVYDITRYCSYRHQIYVPAPFGLPSPFATAPQAYARLDKSHEQCMTTIVTQGQALFDPSNVCDSNLQALSGCCESVHEVLQCLKQEGNSRGIFAQDTAGFDALQSELSEMVNVFSTYCVALCNNKDHAEFCQKYPSADTCVTHSDCQSCSSHGASWCSELGECMCPNKPSPPVSTTGACCGEGTPAPQQTGPATCAGKMFTSPDQCPVSTTAAFGSGLAVTTTAPAATATQDFNFGLGSCPYLESATVWSQESTPKK